jgi:hypothetical protein
MGKTPYELTEKPRRPSNYGDKNALAIQYVGNCILWVAENFFNIYILQNGGEVKEIDND